MSIFSKSVVLGFGINLSILSFSLNAEILPIIDWAEFEKTGETYSHVVIQGPANDKTTMENCLAQAHEDVKRFEERGYKIIGAECETGEHSYNVRLKKSK